MEIKYCANTPVQVGDIICVRDGKSFVPRGIQWFMKVYKKKKKLDPDIPLYHHNGIIIEVWGKFFIAEAVKEGFKIHSMDEAYSEATWENRIDIIRPNMPLSSYEKEILCRIATKFNMKITRYDFLNFFFQIWLIYTGKWIGPRGEKAENRVYCSEAVATIYNYVRAGCFENPAATNPIDVAINPNFHLV